ncbi:unnamed protein product [Amoebophrya sp. A25]|nr:unnamed protein product [Amoebophrya sp. A25]|eukprot:GSA25T00021086001.1
MVRIMMVEERKWRTISIGKLKLLRIRVHHLARKAHALLETNLEILSINLVTSESGDELLKAKFVLRFYWNDPRLADWPDDTDAPVNIWRPELGMLDGVKNTYAEENKAAISAQQAAAQASAAGDEEEEDNEDDENEKNDAAGQGRGGTASPTEDVAQADEATTSSNVKREQTGEAASSTSGTVASSAKRSKLRRRNSESSIVITNPHAEVPLPLFHNGNQGRKAGRLMLEFPLETDNVNMLEDPTRMKPFPFDKLRLDFAVILAGEKRVESADQVCFFWGPPDLKGHHLAVHAQTTIAEFALSAVSYAKAIHASPMTGQRYEDVAFSLHFRRVVVYYLHKGMMPLGACVFFGLCSYTISPEELAGRLQLLVAIFLTCFAIQWIITERLPRVPYLTILDHMVFGAVMSLCWSAAGSCLAYAVGAGSGFYSNVAYDFDMRAARSVDLLTLFSLIALQISWAFAIYVSRILGGFSNFVSSLPCLPRCCIHPLLACCSLPFWCWAMIGKALRKVRGCCGTIMLMFASGFNFKVDPSGRSGSGSVQKKSTTTEEPAPPASKKKKAKRLTRFGTRAWADGHGPKADFMMIQPMQSFVATPNAEGIFGDSAEECLLGVQGMPFDTEHVQDF